MIVAIALCIALPGISAGNAPRTSTSYGWLTLAQAQAVMSEPVMAPDSTIDAEEAALIKSLGDEFSIVLEHGASMLSTEGSLLATASLDTPEHHVTVYTDAITQKSIISLDAIVRVGNVPAAAREDGLIALTAPYHWTLAESDLPDFDTPGEHHLQIELMPSGLQARLNGRLIGETEHELDTESPETTLVALRFGGFKGQVTEISVTRQHALADGRIRAALLKAQKIETSTGLAALDDARNNWAPENATDDDRLAVEEDNEAHGNTPDLQSATVDALSPPAAADPADGPHAAELQTATADTVDSASTDGTVGLVVPEPVTEPGDALVSPDSANAEVRNPDSADPARDPVAANDTVRQAPADKDIENRPANLIANSLLESVGNASSGLLEMAGLDDASIETTQPDTSTTTVPVDVSESVLETDSTAAATGSPETDIALPEPELPASGSELAFENAPESSLPEPRQDYETDPARNDPGRDSAQSFEESGPQLSAAELAFGLPGQAVSDVYSEEEIQQGYSDTLTNTYNDSARDPLLVAIEQQQAQALLEQGVQSHNPSAPAVNPVAENLDESDTALENNPTGTQGTTPNPTPVVQQPSTPQVSTNDSGDGSTNSDNNTGGSGGLIVTGAPTTDPNAGRPRAPEPNAFLGINPATAPEVVSWFRLDESTDDTRGNAAALDLRGAAAYDSATFVWPGNPGGSAVRVAGGNDFVSGTIDVQRIALPGVTERISISAMLYVESWQSEQSGQHGIVQLQLPGSGNLKLEDRVSGRRIVGNNSETLFEPTEVDTALTLNEWHQVRIDLTTAGYELYIDGVIRGTTPAEDDLDAWLTGTGTQTVNIRAGRFTGWIDEIILLTAPVPGSVSTVVDPLSSVGTVQTINTPTIETVTQNGSEQNANEVTTLSGNVDPADQTTATTTATEASTEATGTAATTEPGVNSDGTSSLVAYALTDNFLDSNNAGPELEVSGNTQFDIAPPDSKTPSVAATRFLADGDELYTNLDLAETIDGELLVVVLEARIRVNEWSSPINAPVIQLVAGDRAWFSLSASPDNGPLAAGAGEILIEGAPLDDLLRTGDWHNLSFVMTSTECFFGIDDAVVGTVPCPDALTGWPVPQAELVLGNFDGWIRSVELRTASRTAQ